MLPYNIGAVGLVQSATIKITAEDDLVNVVSLPPGCVVLDCIVEVKEIFNAADSNAVTVGTNADNFNNLLGSSDVDETRIGINRKDAPVVVRTSGEGNTQVVAKYAQVGTEATKGIAYVTVVFVRTLVDAEPWDVNVVGLLQARTVEVTYEDATPVDVVSLPPGTLVVDTIAEIVTAFDAGTTNTLDVGTNSTDFNNLLANTSITEETPGFYRDDAPLAIRTAGSADTVVKAKYEQSGTAATTGKAYVTVVFIRQEV